jgi:hypothetical protein
MALLLVGSSIVEDSSKEEMEVLVFATLHLRKHQDLQVKFYSIYIWS